MNSLLLDFGASRVKAALYDGSKLLHNADYNPVLPELDTNNYFEVSPDKLKSCFESICSDYAMYNYKRIYVCSEMHGFVLTDLSGSYLTNYISWKDNRAIEPIAGINSVDYILHNLPDFKKHTGMNPKPGLPAINLIHMGRKGEVSGDIKMLTLPEIFTNEVIENKVHITMLAGLGVWDIYSDSEYKRYFELCLDLGINLHVNSRVHEVDLISEGIYTAVGDNQCAIYGAKLNNDDVCLNLGTGSQLVVIDKADPSVSIEQRPGIDLGNADLLSVQTHIPSGRALNVYVGFIQSIFDMTGSKIKAWNLLADLTLDELVQADIVIDLAVFESACNFNNYGIIGNINEKNLNMTNFLASLIKSYVEQYLQIIDKYNINYDNIILCGGVAAKNPVIKEYLAYCTNRNIINNCANDETLLGLMRLADV